MKIYDIKVKDMNENETTLKSYEGKLLVIVNTATHCGLTPQYDDMQSLHAKYDEVEVVDFPCNQFMEQAKGSSAEINEFCQLNYKTTFDRFAKIEVNGENTCELYKYLKENTTNEEIEWNFAKFLIDAEGNIVKRYHPKTEVSEVEKDIITILNK